MWHLSPGSRPTGLPEEGGGGEEEEDRPCSIAKVSKDGEDDRRAVVERRGPSTINEKIEGRRFEKIYRRMERRVCE